MAIAGTSVSKGAVGGGILGAITGLSSRTNPKSWAALGAGLGSIGGILGANNAIAEKDHQRLKNKGFDVSRLTGVKKVPKKYLSE